MNTKVKSFKQAMFLSDNKTQPHNRFATRLLPCHTLFEVGSEIRCSDVAAVVMETTQLVLSQFKNFLS